MVVHLKGEVRKRITSGVGPFKRNRWESHPFEFHLEKDGDEDQAHGFHVRRFDVNGGVHLDAKVRNVTCFIADFDDANHPKSVPFSFVSVAKMEISGVASLAE